MTTRRSGMPGHAIFVKRDRRVFAHVHPSGRPAADRVVPVRIS
jgi:hypothetical protein